MIFKIIALGVITILLMMDYALLVVAEQPEPSNSENPNNCETCKWGEWYRQGYDITMMDDECGGCCSWNNKWKAKDEPQTDCAWR